MADYAISLAPIQGITDYVFRNAFATHFGGVDKYYAPYIRTDKLMVGDKKTKDIAPELNKEINLIPQLMGNQAEVMLQWANHLAELGYTEINWNLGCPYPMVTKRPLGAGLLADPVRICQLLDQLMPQLPCRLSIKLRAGLTTADDIRKLLPQLDAYPLTEIILHPRIATQLYKGEADRALFGELLTHTQHPLAYNGDLKTWQETAELHQNYAATKHIMFARGLISNPFLAQQIKSGGAEIPDKNKVFSAFHDELLAFYAGYLSGDLQVIKKMLGLWEYFSLSFNDSHKALKRIKKSKTLSRYQAAVNENLHEGFRND